MGGKKRILLTASAIILLCLTILIGATFGLFSDGAVIHNHLQAGDLEADLWRTNLEYSALDSTGMLAATKIDADLNLSDTKLPELNVFGLDSSNMIIVPRSYVKADMELRNTGNVAFDYTVKLVFTGDTALNNAFAKQLDITIVDPTGKELETRSLDKFTTDGKHYILFSGILLSTPEVTTYTKADFSVKVTFKDDSGINNQAQAAIATFDLIVEAVQAVR